MSIKKPFTKECCLSVCNKCRDDKSCLLFSILDIKVLLNKIDRTLCHYMNEELTVLKYGWGCVETKKVKKLRSLKKGLLSFYTSLLNDVTSCLDNTEIQSLVNNIKLLIISFKDPSIQGIDFNLDNIKYSNTCVPYELWEKALFLKMPQISFQVNIKECLQFVHKIQVLVKDCDPLFKSIIVNIKDTCNFNPKISIDIKQCELEYDKISDKLPFETFINLKKCNLDSEFIATVYNCNLKLDVKAQADSCPILVLSPETSYSLDKINPTIITKILDSK